MPLRKFSSITVSVGRPSATRWQQLISLHSCQLLCSRPNRSLYRYSPFVRLSVRPSVSLLQVTERYAIERPTLVVSLISVMVRFVPCCGRVCIAMQTAAYYVGTGLSSMLVLVHLVEHACVCMLVFVRSTCVSVCGVV